MRNNIKIIAIKFFVYFRCSLSMRSDISVFSSSNVIVFTLLTCFILIFKVKFNWIVRFFN